MQAANVTTIHATKTISAAELISQLAALFPERSMSIRALVACVIAGQNAVILGPPGTGKSLLVRTLAAACGLASWETLMTRFTPPEEVLGPVKFSEIKNDRYTRKHAGFLPSCEVAFLDEVFKSNSAILNALLSILNERIVYDDGAPVAVPLVSCIGASNELPESEDLAALYDRFLVRLNVDYLVDRDARAHVLGMGTPIVHGTLDIAREQATFAAVIVSKPTTVAMLDLQDACRAAGIVISDRRWRQCLSIVRAFAHLDGRTETDPEDLECLENVLWSRPDERANVVKVIAGVVSPHGAKAVEELDMARDIVRRLPPVKGTDAGAYLGSIGTALTDLREIATRVTALPVGGKKVASALTEIQAIQAEVGKLAANAMGMKL